MADVDARVNQAVSASFGRAATGILVTILLAFFGWVGLTINNQGELLAQVKTIVDQTRSDVAAIQTAAEKNRSDVDTRIGQIVDAAAEQRAETQALKQALADQRDKRRGN